MPSLLLLQLFFGHCICNFGTLQGIYLNKNEKKPPCICYEEHLANITCGKIIFSNDRSDNNYIIHNVSF